VKQPLDLVCVVPVYNEAGVLETAVRQLIRALKALLGARPFKVIIASNGSTDRTAEIGRELERRLAPEVELLVCRSKGRGLALREAFAHTEASRYLYIDVDLPCELADLERVLAPLDHGADLVTSRRTGYRPLQRRAMTFVLRQANRLLFGLRVSDSQCAIKALSPAAAQVLVRDCRQNGWFLDTELVVMCRRRGLSVREGDVRWIERRFPGRQSKVRPVADALAAARALAQIRRRAALVNVAGPHK
jgi:glycosyltransferase involved in cell wall biosynthesis